MIPLLDLKAQYATIRAEVREAIRLLPDNQQYKNLLQRILDAKQK